MSASRSFEYIELNRSFRRLLEEAYKDDNQRFDLSVAQGSSLPWDELLKLHRVVILSEAGSGKTMEIREISYRLRDEEKSAFFLRLENISNGLEDAFEVGSYEEFCEWLTTSQQAWLFLDSVDECRLKDPKDFERAIRVVGKELRQAGARVHIVLTSRANAWRPFSDRRMCEAHLSIMARTKGRGAKNEENAELLEIGFSSADQSESEKFQYFTLEDLSSVQVQRYAQAKGVADPISFWDAIEYSGAESLVSRPMDLDILLEVWRLDRRIGSRRELVRRNIEFRLLEHDQDRREKRPLDHQRVRQGSKSLAAATILMRNQEIRVPDGLENRLGIGVESILVDWDDRDQQTLLSRPLFEKEFYGTVRFHHRSTREYLVAEWFSDLLSRGASRRNVESLFFQEWYGQPIVTPALRSILPWLVLMNERICESVQKLAPEIFLEGGDPSGLSGETRYDILRQLCERISQGSGEKWPGDPEFIALFAQQDLTDSVRHFLLQYAQSDAVLEFLLLLVVKGKLSGAWIEVESIIRSKDGSDSVRKWGWVAANAIESDVQLLELRTWYLESSSEVDRKVLSILVEGLPSSDEAIEWLLMCLQRCPSEKKYAYDALKYNLTKYVEEVDLELLPHLIDGFQRLLGSEPLLMEQEFKISSRLGWLMESACQAVIRLIQCRHQASLGPGALAILLRFEDLYHYHDYDLDRKILPGLVAGWPELNHVVFWSEVEHSREKLEVEGQGSLTNWWQVYPRNLWGFQNDSFPLVVQDIADKPSLDDKLVALSLAYHLYQQAGCPSEGLTQIKQSVQPSEEMTKTLEQFLSPPEETPITQKMREQQEKWKREEEARKIENSQHLEKAQAYFRTNLGKLREAVATNSSQLHNDVWYLFHVCQSKDSSHSRWTVTNWKALEPEYGSEVARFFRDAAVGFWRHHVPQLRSEGASSDKVTYAVLVGLAGLAIESQEDPTWMEALTPEQVERACRFASFEMNGFPEWFPGLFERFPDVVGSFLMQEIRYQLSKETADGSLHHLIQPLSWSGHWSWDWLAPRVLEFLSSSEPSNQATLDALLKVVQGSTLGDDLISKLAAKKCLSEIGVTERTASWCALWMGSDPINGLEFFKRTLQECSDPKLRTEFAMHFITRLVGGRGADKVVAREAFRNPQYLKDLYLLMHRHIRVEDDIDRSNGGVYSPELRDNAQSARNSIFGLLEQIPGKESYLAICDIANQAHQGHARLWMFQRAKAKAEQDGDLPTWSPEQVREFQAELERTPTNHKELAELAKLRLLDLKDDLENGDNSQAPLLIAALNSSSNEESIRNYIGHVLREKAFGRYSIEQEGELADGKRTDLRFIGTKCDFPVPVELKLADNWPGPHCVERLVNQLCGDYLRDRRSNRGIFLLVNHVKPRHWMFPGHDGRLTFPELVVALQEHWESIKSNHSNIDHIDVIGIDLTARTR